MPIYLSHSRTFTSNSLRLAGMLAPRKQRYGMIPPCLRGPGTQARGPGLCLLRFYYFVSAYGVICWAHAVKLCLYPASHEYWKLWLPACFFARPRWTASTRSFSCSIYVEKLALFVPSELPAVKSMMDWRKLNSSAPLCADRLPTSGFKKRLVCSKLSIYGDCESSFSSQAQSSILLCPCILSAQILANQLSLLANWHRRRIEGFVTREKTGWRSGRLFQC